MTHYDYEWPPMFDDTSTWERAYQEWDRRTASHLIECLRAESVEDAVIVSVAERFRVHISSYPTGTDIASRLEWLDRGLWLLDWAKRYVDKGLDVDPRQFYSRANNT